MSSSARRARDFKKLSVLALAGLGVWVGCGPSTDPQDPSTAQVASSPAATQAAPLIVSSVPVAPPQAPSSASPSSPPASPAVAQSADAPVVIGDPGPVDPEEAKALAAMSDTQRPVFLAVKVCTEEALKKNEEPKGSLAIELTIAADGTVAGIKLGSGYPPGMGACVENRVRAIAFPKGGSARFVRFPINESSR